MRKQKIRLIWPGLTQKRRLTSRKPKGQRPKTKSHVASGVRNVAAVRARFAYRVQEKRSGIQIQLPAILPFPKTACRKRRTGYSQIGNSENTATNSSVAAAFRESNRARTPGRDRETRNSPLKDVSASSAETLGYQQLGGRRTRRPLSPSGETPRPLELPVSSRITHGSHYSRERLLPAPRPLSSRNRIRPAEDLVIVLEEPAVVRHRVRRIRINNIVTTGHFNCGFEVLHEQCNPLRFCDVTEPPSNRTLVLVPIGT